MEQKKRHVILSEGECSDYGEVTLISDEVLQAVYARDLSLLSKAVADELWRLINHSNLTAHEIVTPATFWNYIHGPQSLRSFYLLVSHVRHFSTIGELVNYCVSNGIQIESTITDSDD